MTWFKDKNFEHFFKFSSQWGVFRPHVQGVSRGQIWKKVLFSNFYLVTTYFELQCEVQTAFFKIKVPPTSRDSSIYPALFRE